MAVPANHWLSALALSSITGRFAPGSSKAASAPVTPTADLSRELCGTWLDSWSTSMQYSLAANAYDFEADRWCTDLCRLAPYRGFGLSLAADGTFLWVRGGDVGQSYGVHIMRGAVTVERSALRFHPTAQRQRYESTSDPAFNFDRELPNVDFTMPFEIGATQDSKLETLTLVDEGSGATLVYFRQ